MPKFVPRERKHRRLAKQVTDNSIKPLHHDANVEVITAADDQDKEARRRELQIQLRAQQGQEKISSKKRKRLEHYVETKLRKEENSELIKKLAKHQINTDLLQSSKRLGQVHETKQDAFRRALREREAGIDVYGDQEKILYQKRRDTQEEVSDTEDTEHTKSIPNTTPTGSVHTSTFGSGLKQSLGGQTIARRKRRKKTERHDTQHITLRNDDGKTTTDLVWDGFSSDEDERQDGLVELASTETVHNEDDSSSVDNSSEMSDHDSGNDSSDETSSDEEDNTTDRPARASAFKQWATSQRNDALGFTPSTAPLNDEMLKAKFKPRQPSPDRFESTSQNIGQLARPQNALIISRDDEVQNARLALPVVQEEQRIIEAIHNNPVVIVCGATGSGKTTQVPQMLYESGYGSHCGEEVKTSSLQNRGMIGVTQPRRVAAVSVASRVAVELGTPHDVRVAHQVRYDTTVSKKTAIKFMTDGILLREIHEDFILSKYSVVVIDEAHERSVNTDILIGTLSRIVDLRDELTKEDAERYYPLKLIIMSATLRVTDFAQNQRLFRGLPPPIIEAEGRQYPVTIHFAKHTQRDYVQDIVTKVVRGHKKLPAGGMLVFLTGQNEINTAARLLRNSVHDTSGFVATRGRESSDQVPLEVDDIDTPYDHADNSDIEFDGLDEDESDFELGEDGMTVPDIGTAHSSHAHILPLYAALPTSQQMRIFQSPPAGSRLIVLATNVAETSLTIPGIRFVFDCGRSKEKKYDQQTGVQTFEIDWISKASASQRAGRAGRTGPGHCWRLYSSAIYEEFFAEHSLPEILRSPIESTVLQLKAMNVDNVVNFPFPTPPDRTQLQTAETLLCNLGALDDSKKITQHGRTLMQYPVSPRFSKMLQIAAHNGILDHTVAMVAGLAVGDLYIPELQTIELEDSDGDQPRRQLSTLAMTQAQKRHQAYTRAQALMTRWDDHSDVIKLLTAVAAHADASNTDKVHGGHRLAEDLFLRDKGMTEVQQLRQQLHNIIRSQHRHSSVQYNPLLSVPDMQRRRMLNQTVAAGYLDQIAIRADLLGTHTTTRAPRSAIEVAYRPLFPLESVDHKLPIEEQDVQRSVYVHPSSVLARLSKTEMPSYVVYSHLSKAAPKVIGDVIKTRMHPLTTISAKALAVLAQDTPLFDTGKPIGKIEDKDGGKSRVCWVAVSLKPSTEGVAWPLCSWKVAQTRDRQGNWQITRVIAR